VRARENALYGRYRSWFLGRVEDPGAIYANARLALLPTTSGHGLSIKSVEAMASGLPLIATRHALRGMDEAAFSLQNLTLADAPQDFAAALRNAAELPGLSEAERRASASRRYYEQNFSATAYQRNLLALIAPLAPRI